MASEECVASSCASAQSSSAPAAQKVLILDYRGGFSRCELDLNVQESFSDIFKRAQLKTPVDTDKDSVSFVVEHPQISLTSSDFECKLVDKSLSGVVKIIIRDKNSLSADQAYKVSSMRNPETHYDAGFDDDDDDNDGASCPRGAPKAPPAPTAAAAAAVVASAGQPKISPGIIDASAIAAAAAAKKERLATHSFEEPSKPSPAGVVGKVLPDNKTGNKTCVNEESSYSSYSSYDSRSSTGFAGLNNQGATCYMNSLIQSLYMNPEFRKLVYDWSFEDHFQKLLKKRREKSKNMTAEDEAKFRAEKEKNSIPLQLQSLFAQMQLTQSRAVSTKKLTTSFAWDAADSFTQHDVTELRAVLFEALEKAMAGTTQATGIKDLFEGEILEYVRCLGCQHESTKSVPLYEVLLDVKAFGETKAVKSVEEAMEKFITPEVLDEDNLYECSACGNKCRAVKGARFKRFPYFLVMQLKRFSFDFVTMDRVKLCDRVTFPYTFDAADYLEGGKIDAELMAKAVSAGKVDEKKEDAAAQATTDADEDDNDNQGPVEQMQQHAQEPEEEEGAGAPERTPEENKTDEKKSDQIYDLFAILIHSGSANGGHYYAYIKDYRSNKWFEFNDSSVRPINDADIESVFGKDSSSDSGGYSYYNRGGFGTTAYMMMYRKVDPAKNILPCTDDEVPENLREYVKKQNAEEEEKKRKERLERETCHVKVKYNGKEMKFDKHELLTIGDLKSDVLKAFECEANAEDTRLVLVYRDTEESLPDLDTLRMHNICSWRNDMILEVKKPGEEWVIKNPNMITLHVHYEDKKEKDSNDETADPEVQFIDFDVSIDKTLFVKDLRCMISEKLGIESSRLRLILKTLSSYDKLKTLKHDTESLSYSWVDNLCDIYAEECDDPQTNADATNSRIFRALAAKENVINYHIVVKDGEDFYLPFDKTRPLKELRTLLSAKTNIPYDKVVMIRDTGSSKQELKELDKSVDDCCYWQPYYTLRVEEGIMGTSEINVLLWLPDANRTEFLFKAKIVESHPVSEALSTIVAKYKEELGDSTDCPRSDDDSCYVLRKYEFENDFPGKIYDPSVPLNSVITFFYEGTKVILDVVPKPITFPEPKGTVHIFCYEWHPSTLTVDPIALEITMNKHSPINDIRRTLVSIHRPPKNDDQSKEEVPREFLAENVCIRALSGFGTIKAPSVEEMLEAFDQAPVWEKGEDITPHDIKDLYLRSGISIVFWDGSEPQKELSADAKAALKAVQPAASSESKTSALTVGSAGSSAGLSAASRPATNYRPNYWARKEKAIKIHVDDDDDDDDDDDASKKPAETAAAAADAGAAAPAAESNDNAE